MGLLTENELIWSPVVVNNRMNRERIATGINSYEKELSFRPEKLLESCLHKNGIASWMDVCCGKGNALIQASHFFKNIPDTSAISLHGIDLIECTIPDQMSPRPIIETCSAVGWQPSQQYDLITCIHGLHYIGDKLAVIQKAIAALKPEGLFVAHLDLNNIKIEEEDSPGALQMLFKQNQLNYNSRKRLLKKTGPARVEFDLVFQGADDQAGPNYTGQEAVTSYYSYRHR